MGTTEEFQSGRRGVTLNQGLRWLGLHTGETARKHLQPNTDAVRRGTDES